MDRSIRDRLLDRFRVPGRLWALYICVYFLAGLCMNGIGIWLEIARFQNWWQVFTVYVLYMVPVSLLVRDMTCFRQYVYGLLAMGLLEFSGYALETSYAYPGNVLDRLFGVRNFALAMTLFFAAYFPAGNALVDWLYRRWLR